jgi:hypothetical protein
MVEDETKSLNNPALLKQIFVKLEAIDARLQLVEAKIDRRSFDTKPIWERALAEIMEVNQRVTTIDRKMDVLGKDMLNLRADHLGVEDRLRKLEEARDEEGRIRTIG